MALPIRNSDLLDVLAATTANLPDLQIEYALNRQDYLALNQWFRGRLEEDGGTMIERKIVLNPAGNARHIGLLQKITGNIMDVISTIRAPWVRVHTNYVVTRAELDQNKGDSKFVDVLQTRRAAAAINLADEIDIKAFASPMSALDEINPYGLSYWLSKADDGVESPGGWIGRTIRFGDGTTSTVKGGLDAAVHEHWRSYAATYTGVNRALLRTLRRAFKANMFRTPNLPNAPTFQAPRYMLCTSLDVSTEYEDLLDTLADRTAPNTEGGPAVGGAFFRRVPLEHAPSLNDDPDAPIYGVNMAKFFPIVLSGGWLREHEAMEDVELPDVFVTHVTGHYQLFCTNVKHAGFVIHRRRG